MHKTHSHRQVNSVNYLELEYCCPMDDLIVTTRLYVMPYLSTFALSLNLPAPMFASPLFLKLKTRQRPTITIEWLYGLYTS